MEEHLNLPDSGKLSTVSAMVILAYTLLPFTRASTQRINLSILGFLVDFQLNMYVLVSLLVALLTAFGMDWMLRDHPFFNNQGTLPYMILPTLTTAAIGLPLGILEVSPSWWVIMILGSILLILVLIAEYISIDQVDVRYPLALMVLSGISYSLFLILSIVVRSLDLRLYLMILLLPLFFAFLSLRILQFRLGGGWHTNWTFAITLIFAQILTAMYYWPLSPIRFGLFILGPAYALIGTAAFLAEKRAIRNLYLEPFIIMGLFWIAGIFIA